MTSKKNACGPMEYTIPEAALKRMRVLLPSIIDAAKKQDLEALYTMFVMSVNPSYKQYGKTGVFRFLDESVPIVEEKPKSPEHIFVEEHFEILTKKEREVVSYLAHGRSNKEIAEALNISTRTVESHVNSIMKKTNFTSRGQITAAFFTSTAFQRII